VNVLGATVSLSSLLLPHKAWPEYEHAERALTQHNFKEAEKELIKVLSIYPKSAVAWCFMGTLREETKAAP